MSDQRGTRLRLSAPLRWLPADLAAVTALVLLTVVVVFAPVVRETPLRVALGLPFMLFVPGYAFIAALFPDAGEGRGPEGSRGGGIDGVERFALSVGLSIAIVPLIGMLLNLTPVGIRLAPVVGGVSGFTVVSTAVATYRRWALPADERFRVPYRGWLASGRSALFGPDTPTDGLLNVVLVVSLLVAVGSVGFAVAFPKQGESFTEFYLLTENETGALVADDYPSNLTVGEARPVVVSIGNHEHERMSYTVVVQEQRISFQNDTTRVRERRELDRLRTAVADDGTWRTTYAVEPVLAGDQQRLVFLLYRGDPPASPTISSAYRETHLYLNVSGSGSTR